MIESISGLPSDWKVCNGTSGTPNLKDKFVLGDGGSLPNTGGFTSACALGHFHAGMAYAIHSGDMNRGGIFGISESFDHGGGTAGTRTFNGVDYGGQLFSKLQGNPNCSQTPSGSSDNGNCGSAILNLGENTTNTHKHSINTWGELYDNDSYPGNIPTGSGIPGGWSTIGGNNVSTNSDTTNRNLPPYIALYFIKFS